MSILCSAVTTGVSSESTTPRSERLREKMFHAAFPYYQSRSHTRGRNFRAPTAIRRFPRHKMHTVVRPVGLDRYEVRSFPLALVFRHPFERNPRRRRCVLTIFREFEHPFHVVDFDGYEVVFPHLIRRQPIEKVTAFSLDSLVAFGHLLELFLPGSRTVFFPRELSLIVFVSLTVN